MVNHPPNVEIRTNQVVLMVKIYFKYRTSDGF